ncbi:sugar phosphate isomerase/epimerase family protein [Chthonobacter albigriseus]|uniref:sugar phosphate isomerase/epimerase family protein n=1 Tax=Chthonobacter albigriseus TaxID=1683161 RepID=UPI0015EEDD56|nr:sugar phosphate isomerase/epimerase [Chthonobacter albigriseus]
MPAKVGYSLIAERPDFADLSGALDEAEALEVDSVELPVYALDMVVGGRIRDDRVAACAERLGGRPFGYTVHGVLGINLMSAPERVPLHVEVALANIEIARRLGVRTLVIHTGHLRSAEPGEIASAYARQKEALRRLGDVAAEKGVLLCVENVFSFSGEHTATPARLADELAAVDHPAVVATFDVSHGALQCAVEGRDFFAEALQLAPLSRHVHVHDSFGRPGDFWVYHRSEALAFGAGDLHIPVGWGNLPWDRLAAEAGFPADVVLNIELDAPYWAEIGATVAATRRLAALVDAAGTRS